MKKMKKIVLLVGIPGSGKSTFVDELCEISNSNFQVISLDDIRLALGHQYSIKTEPVVKMMVDVMARAYCERGLNIIIDANLMYYFLYEKWVKLAEEYGYSITIYYTEAHIKTCIKRREGIVDENTIIEMEAKTLALLQEFLNREITVFCHKTDDSEKETKP